MDISNKSNRESVVEFCHLDDRLSTDGGQIVSNEAKAFY